MDSTLHPALARIAASYDEIVLEFQQGRLTAPESRRRIMSLVARDDNGVEWSIDPDSGRWRYRTTWGEFAYADPPGFGMVPVTAHDLGAGSGRHLDDRVIMHDVDMDRVSSPDSLFGSTFSPTGPASKSAKRRWGARQFAGVALILLGVCGLAALLLAR